MHDRPLVAYANSYVGANMEQYNLWGDTLNKLSQLTPWVQAVIGLGFFGMVVALAHFLKECVAAIMKPFFKHDKPNNEKPKKEWKDKYYRDGS